MEFKTLLLVSIILGASFCMYDDNDLVVNITKDKWDEIKEGKELWFVEFYAPWCGHCKSLAPEYKAAAKELDGMVKFGAVDMTDAAAQPVGAPYGIQGYPTIKFFGRDKSEEPKSYEWARKTPALVKYGLNAVKRAAAEADGEAYEDEPEPETKKDKDPNEGVDDGWHKKKDPFVTNLSKDNWEELVMNSEDTWIIEFYAPWCSHCKAMNGVWSETARALRRKVKVGKFDVTPNHPDPIVQRVDIEGYPTIKFYGPGKKEDEKGITYKGNRQQAETIEAWALKEKRRVLEGEEALLMDGSVHVLDNNNFNTTVYGSEEPWFIEFYAPWCGHCKTLQPIWEETAKELAGKVQMGKVNADDQDGRPLGQRLDVRGFPSIKFWPSGLKGDSVAVTYDGARDQASMVEWALEMKRTLKPLEVPQLVDQTIYDEFCADFRGVCIITFLPHIYDCTDKERREYISTVKSVAASFVGKPFSFIWSQAGDQFDLEQVFALGSFYPTVIAISSAKKLYAVMRNSFSEKNLQHFVTNLSVGKEGLGSIRQAIVIKESSKWEDDKSGDQEEEVKTEEEPTKENKEDL